MTGSSRTALDRAVLVAHLRRMAQTVFVAAGPGPGADIADALTAAATEIVVQQEVIERLQPQLSDATGTGVANEIRATRLGQERDDARTELDTYRVRALTAENERDAALREVEAARISLTILTDLLGKE